MSQATNRRYDQDALLRINGRYNEEHTLTQEDVDAVNSMVVHIEATRSTTEPKPGDRFTFTSREGDYKPKALIEEENDFGLKICTDPCIPLASLRQDGIHCSVSGGGFSNLAAKNLTYLSTKNHPFCIVGHCGRRGNCHIYFEANVSHWEYREPSPLFGDFTTKTHRKIHLFIAKNAVAEYKYLGDGLAFKDDDELQAFLNAYKGTIFPGYSSDQIIVWCFHDEIQSVSRAEWEAIDAPVTQRYFGISPRNVKIQKDMVNNTVHTYYAKD